MANAYVTLNSKRYAVSDTRYEPQREKLQRVHISVGGTHIAQSFNFIEYRWGFDLIVPYTGAGDYGSLDNLKTAYNLAYCSFTDHYGTSYDVFFEGGPLSERPRSPMIDGLATFTVSVNLRRKQ